MRFWQKRQFWKAAAALITALGVGGATFHEKVVQIINVIFGG